MAFYQELRLHQGEERMRKKMNVPSLDNPTVPTLSPQLANHLQIAPLIAVGTLDTEGRPWTTLWGCKAPLAMPMGSGIAGVRTIVSCYDPLVEILVGSDPGGQIRRESGKGRMVSGLTIDLETRKRVKLFGRMVAGALGTRDDEATGKAERIAEIQLVLKIEQSLGNCPKYLNSRKIVPAESNPEIISSSTQLPQQAVDLIGKADMFFVTSKNGDVDMDTNHRGGPPGFVRVGSNSEEGAVLVWPEYSGNRLYQTLGNLSSDPIAGLCLPDLLTGDVLFLTGTTKILVGTEATDLLPRSNLCVQFTLTAARMVARCLPFRGIPGQASPYNPPVRYLAAEKFHAPIQARETQQATLIAHTKLTPTISRFKFASDRAIAYKPGQYVSIDFSNHLDIGYSHMRDDDPTSLNDDFIRTFTVSSSPDNPRLPGNEFEITIRKVGVATEFLFKLDSNSAKDRLDFEVRGFGGDFKIRQTENETICFIAAGVGITPILPSLESMDFSRLKLVWTVRIDDLGLVLDTVHNCPEVAPHLSLFVTNTGNGATAGLQELTRAGTNIQLRRINETDLKFEHAISKYYLCTGVHMREQLTEWLLGEEIVFEDFNF